MKCFRCQTEVEPDDKHADYIIGDDTIVEEEGKKVTKTAIICPSCYKVSDFVIWGIHKQE